MDVKKKEINVGQKARLTAAVMRVAMTLERGERWLDGQG